MQEWGCFWFGPWMKNVRRATALGQTCLVFFFEGQLDIGIPDPLVKPWAVQEPGVGLGNSQKGEVAWMLENEIRIESRDMSQWDDFVKREMGAKLGDEDGAP